MALATSFTMPLYRLIHKSPSLATDDFEGAQPCTSCHPCRWARVAPLKPAVSSRAS